VTSNDEGSVRADVRCAGCGRVAPVQQARAGKWTHWVSGGGELVPFCGPCAEREFGIPAVAGRTEIGVFRGGGDRLHLREPDGHERS